jgi:hypothetical protein
MLAAILRSERAISRHVADEEPSKPVGIVAKNPESGMQATATLFEIIEHLSSIRLLSCVAKLWQIVLLYSEASNQCVSPPRRVTRLHTSARAIFVVAVEVAVVVAVNVNEVVADVDSVVDCDVG